MRVSDYISKRLFQLGIKDIFMVTGGAAMHLNDSFGIDFKGNIHYLHHEQSCAMAAESYGRVSNKPAVVNVTAGPGSINAINGVFGAFVDSIPMIIISGQAKTSTLKSNSGLKNLRQLGDQEVDIIKMVSGITKYSRIIEDPFLIQEELDKAYSIATGGRFGPVWLDIPIDIQGAKIPSMFIKNVSSPLNSDRYSKINKIKNFRDHDINLLAKKLLNSNRPILYIGSGIRSSNCYLEMLDFLKEWPIATVTGWNSHDLLWDSHENYVGRPGTIGNRGGNFAVQFSDCLLITGCRLNIRQISYNWNSFGKNAWKCQVDIDKDELNKPTLSTDLKINSDLKGFFNLLSNEMKTIISNKQIDKNELEKKWLKWLIWCKDNNKKYPAYHKGLKRKNDSINPYKFIDSLSTCLNEDSLTVCADGTACVVGFQAFKVKPNQRLFHNSGCASMGYELPASIGAYLAKKSTIICISGDGSIMMNLQELTLIGQQKLPIKIFLLNNKGYHSIRQTQKNYFPDNSLGCGEESGLPFPDFKKIAYAFSINYLVSKNEESIEQDIIKTINIDGPVLHEIILNLDQDFSPKLSSKKLEDGSMISSELEDMYPFLDKDIMNKIRNVVVEI